MSLEPAFTNDLEDTLLNALSHSTPPVKRKPRDPSARSGHFDHRQWCDGPENWTRTKGVALIHSETQTLLGNFSEYKHNRYPDARRLVRETEPLLIESTEYVSGKQWVVTEAVQLEWERSIEYVDALIDIILPELGMRALNAEVKVELLWKGINRVELKDRTEFHSEDRKATIWIPKGVDVLNGLSLDCKLALKNEIASSEDEEEPLQGS